MPAARLLVALLILQGSAVSEAVAQPPNPRWTRSGHRSEPLSIVFSADSRWLLTAGTDGLIRVWDAASLLLHRTIVVRATVTSMAASRDGAVILASDGVGRLHVVDAEQGLLTRSFRPVMARTNSVRLSGDGQLAIVAYNDGIARLVDVGSGTILEEYVGHTSQVTGADISADGSTVVTSSDDFTTRIWRGRPSELLHTIQEVQYASNAVALSPDASALAATGFHVSGTLNSKRGISLFSTATGTALRQLTGAFIEPLTGLAFSADGRFLAITAHDHEEPQTLNGLSLMVMDLLDGSRSWGWKGPNHIGWSNGAAFAPNGGAIAWVAAYGTVFLRRIASTPEGPEFRGTDTITDHVQPVRAAALSRDDSLCYAGDDSGMVRIWRARSADRVAAFRAHTMSVRAIDERPDGEGFLTASVDGTVKIWRADRSLQRTLYLSAEYPVTSARFLANDRLVAGIGGFDSTAVLLDTGNSRPILRFRGATAGINAVDVTPSTGMIVTASQDGRGRVYSTSGAMPVMTTGPHSSPMSAVAFSRDGDLLFCGHHDGSIRMLDAASGFELHSLRAHSGAVTALRVAYDGSLVSSSLDSTIAVWSVGAEALVPHRRYREHPAGIATVACGYQTSLLFAGADDATVMVYDAASPAAAPRRAPTTAALSITAYRSGDALVVGVSGEPTGTAVLTVHDVLGRELARQEIGVNAPPVTIPLARSGSFLIRARASEHTALALCN